MVICRLPAQFFTGTKDISHPIRPLPCAITSLSPSKTVDLVESRMFMLGMGYVGQFFGQQLKNEGWVVKGTCRSSRKKKELEEIGFDAFVFNASEPESSVLSSVSSCTHLLVSIPPVPGLGDPLLKHGELLRGALGDGSLQWLCYLSSTGVYGDCSGAWVDEDYLANPSIEPAKSRLLAENEWLSFGDSLGLSTQVLRLGGIYGPGRSAIDTMIKQQPLTSRQKMRSSKRYTSRVHVEDICQALRATIEMPSIRRIYNVVDDDPAPREEVFAYAEDLVEKKWPGFIEQAPLTPKEDKPCVFGKRSSRGEKRVSNARMKSELGVKLRHPSYRSGLLSITEQLTL
ncbi:unnamed protein product [Linum tenue]|uniref:NAD-dependent epimerase/dehydratase domain-containing protein n=2 Tax=Linum tenue TaxID=586396 RepID=A0AAV0LPP4_9ROSI|nr:unnamed protein product [Linum tenue]